MEAIRVPTIGENIESGDVVKVLVTVGQTIQVDQPLLELETDKAVVEIPAPRGGTVKKILVKAGDTIKIGQVIVEIDPADPGATVRKQDRKMESGGGQATAAQATAAKRADAPPREAPATPPAPDRREPKTMPAPAAAGATVSASPAVRRLARELGVDLSAVAGSGEDGRISADDVKAHVQERMSAPEPAPGLPPAPLPDFSRWGPVEREPLSKVRRITAQNMTRAWTTIPHVTHFDRADVTRLEAFRRQAAPRIEAAGGRLTVTAILLKVCAAALRIFPRFNSSLDEPSEELILKRYYHIGVAVDTDRGLIVPVLRDLDRKPLSQVAVELHELAQRTRDKRVAPDELDGGTFTISNLGGIGGTGFAPIVYPPQVAILGVARTQSEPRLVDGEWQNRLILPLALSYDHRVIDGADGARFLAWIAEALEDPYLLVTES
jgi:pyruvate dehydrogenase E2 component (dihydrolipoamide acetyltransferase)